MKANKLTPQGYALAAFLLVPLAVVAVLLLAVLVLVGAVIYWPIVPFVVYSATKPERKSYGKLDLSEQDSPAPAS